MARHVAFARGINVGGKNRIKMPRLCTLFEEEGALDVQHYIQSGNILFSAGSKSSKQELNRLLKRVTSRLDEEDKLQVPFCSRPLKSLEKLISAHPYLPDEADERMVSVGFLSDKPTAARVKALDPERSPGDRFTVKGEEVFLHTPHGMARTKLTNDYFDRGLGCIITVRNLKTLRALVAAG